MTTFEPGWLHRQVDSSVAYLERLPPPYRSRTYMDNQKACGALANSKWGYLPCGCRNDGYGQHIR